MPSFAVFVGANFATAAVLTDVATLFTLSSCDCCKAARSASAIFEAAGVHDDAAETAAGLEAACADDAGDDGDDFEDGNDGDDAIESRWASTRRAATTATSRVKVDDADADSLARCESSSSQSTAFCHSRSRK